MPKYLLRLPKIGHAWALCYYVQSCKAACYTTHSAQGPSSHVCIFITCIFKTSTLFWKCFRHHVFDSLFHPGRTGPADRAFNGCFHPPQDLSISILPGKDLVHKCMQDKYHVISCMCTNQNSYMTTLVAWKKSLHLMCCAQSILQHIVPDEVFRVLLAIGMHFLHLLLCHVQGFVHVLVSAIPSFDVQLGSFFFFLLQGQPPY